MPTHEWQIINRGAFKKKIYRIEDREPFDPNFQFCQILGKIIEKVHTILQFDMQVIVHTFFLKMGAAKLRAMYVPFKNKDAFLGSN